MTGKGKRRKRIRSLLCLLAAFLLCLPAAGCRAEEEDRRVLIGVCQANMTERWQLAFRSDFEDAMGDREHVRCLFSDAGDSSQRQRTNIEDMIRRSVDVLVVTPCADGDIVSNLFSAIRQGIPVIILGDRPGGTESYTVRIYADNYGLGRKAGELAAQLLEGEGTVLEMQGEDRRMSEDIKKGFLDALSGSPGVVKEYVVAGYGGYDSAEEALRASEILETGGRVDLIFGHNYDMTRGAGAYAHACGKAPLLLGIDRTYRTSLAEELYGENELTAFVAVSSGGREAAECCRKLLDGEELPKELVLEAETVIRGVEDHEKQE